MRRALLLPAAAVLALSAQAKGQSYDCALSVSEAGSTREAVVLLNRDGEALTGQWIGADATEPADLSGVWTGETVRFNAPGADGRPDAFAGIALETSEGGLALAGRSGPRFSGAWSGDCRALGALAPEPVEDEAAPGGLPFGDDAGETGEDRGFGDDAPGPMVPEGELMASGGAALDRENGFDLDAMALTERRAEGADLELRTIGRTMRMLAVDGGARMALYGADRPGYTDCFAIRRDLRAMPLRFDELSRGDHVCLLTDDGRYGAIELRGLPGRSDETLRFDARVWSNGEPL